MFRFEKAKTYVSGALTKKELGLSAVDVAGAREYILNYWPILIHTQTKDVGSLIGVPYPYLVPSSAKGHEFDYEELFYWDSYFMVQGLWDQKHKDLISGIADDLIFLFNRFHVIPNSSQYYMTSRSQPPFLTSLLFEIYEHYDLGQQWINERMKVAEEEYHVVWMGQRKPNARQVYRGLSRYYDYNYLNDIAETESGWDMTTRFYRKALNFLPVDLNALLYKYETDFARLADINGDSQESEKWKLLANQRRDVMNELMWDKSKGLYFDFDYTKRKRGSIASLASYYPMWAGMVNDQQAALLVKSLKRFENNGGLSATDFSSSLLFSPVPTQWDYPNGWAPLHFIVIQALERYGYHNDAKRLANKWLRCNLDWFLKNGVFLEKYNVVNTDKPPKKGLYPSQIGFGWTNSIFERFCKDYIDSSV